MIYLKRFENWNINSDNIPYWEFMEEEINYVLMELSEDFPELKFNMNKYSSCLWKFESGPIIGIRKTESYYNKMSDYFKEISGRLLELSIRSHTSFRRIN